MSCGTIFGGYVALSALATLWLCRVARGGKQVDAAMRRAYERRLATTGSERTS